jgi:chromosome partition protein MukE
MSRGFALLQDVIAEVEFPELDLALRRGRHVDREDGAWYQLLLDAQEHLEAFYRRYGCELIYKTDGYFYLLPISEQLPRRHLAITDMLVGQAMALLYLDPASVERGGLVAKEQVLEQLVTAMGSDALIRAFLPKRRRYDERVAQKQVRGKLAEAIRRLAGLGFAELVESEQLRLRPALLRFAEPVRGLAEPADALARLVAQGEVALAAHDDQERAEDPDAEPDADAARADEGGDAAIRRRRAGVAPGADDDDLDEGQDDDRDDDDDGEPDT